LDKLRLDSERRGEVISADVVQALDDLKQAATSFLTSPRPVAGQGEQAFSTSFCTISMDEAAAIAGRDRRTITRWIEQGLPAVKQAGRWLVERSDLENYIEKRQNARP
jgi:excisionase family DNA binding protein